MSSSSADFYAVGNQAGDVDSIVSAIVASFYVREGLGRSECRPLVAFPRKDFRLRGDAVHLFKLAGWPLNEDGTPSDLAFLDEVSTVKDVVLTDANTIGPHIAGFKPNVVAIFDHHRDEKQHLEASPRLIDESAGSACSVVLREIFAKDDLHKKVPRELLILLFGTILLDTRNFKENRHNHEDEIVFGKLCEQLGGDLMNDQKHIFRKLMDARNDVSHLSIADLLRLDYKQVDEHDEAIGFSTMLTNAKDLFAPGKDLARAMSQMIDENRLSALVAITSAEKGSERRGLVICSPKTPLAEAMVDGLKANPKDVFSSGFLSLPLVSSQKIIERGFGLEPYALHVPEQTPKLPKSSTHFTVWSVHGTITRKTLLPAIMELVARSKRL